MDGAALCREMTFWRPRVTHVLVVIGLAGPSFAAAQPPPAPVPLQSLVREAQQNNRTIAASRHAWEASTHAAAQAEALPGPEVTIQHVSVGSPRPFAGFSTSDFAYIGIGASQELPYPGKRALRGEVAEREAQSLRAQSDATSRHVIESLILAYVRLAYDQQTVPLLEDHDRILTQIQETATSRYRAGTGDQQDVLNAQLQHTKLLVEMATRREDAGTRQAELKALLNRGQDSPDIVTEPLTPTPISSSIAALAQRAGNQNPDVQARVAIVDRDRAQLDLAHKAFKPDFDVQYMYQHTASAFRDYYMGTFSVRLPNRGGARAALAEAEEHQAQATDELEAERQRVGAEMHEQYIAIQGSSERLMIYRDGLVPQANARFQAAMAAYAANRQDFETLLSAFGEVLDIGLAYTRELADHESAVARLERLVGDERP